MLENMELIYPQNWTQGARKMCLKKQNEKWQGGGNEKKGKTFITLSEGKAQQKKQRNSVSTQGALVWTGLKVVDITAGYWTKNSEVKNREGELFFVTQVTNF